LENDYPNNNINNNNNIENTININANSQLNSLDDIENEKYISELMKIYLRDRIIIIEIKIYIGDKNKHRLIIDDYMEKIKIIL